MKIEIPAHLGTITSSFESPGSRQTIVIHKTVDLAPLDLALNEVSLLEHLVQNYGFREIYTDSATRKQPRLFTEIHDEKIRKEKLMDYLKRGEISPAEYLNSVSEIPLVLQGIEDNQILDESYKIMNSVPKYLPPFNNVANNLSSLIRSIRAELKDPSITYDDLRAQMFESTDSLRNFDLYRNSLIQQLGINALKKYPEAIRWNSENLDEYSKQSESLDDEICDRLCQTREQRNAAKISRNLEMMARLVNYKMSEGEFKLFKQRRHELTTLSLIEFFKTHGKNMPREHLDIIDLLVPQMEKFYELTRERQQTMVKKTLEFMANKTTGIMFLAGYHAQPVANLLRQKGVSCLILTPKIPNLGNIRTVGEVYKEMIGKSIKGLVDKGLSEEEANAFAEVFPEFSSYEPRLVGRGLYKKAILLQNPKKLEAVTLKLVDLANLHPRALAYIERKGFRNPLDAFQNEEKRINALRKLSNPHISEVLETKMSSNRRFYFFLERYSERTLEDYITNNHPLPYELVKNIALQLADGLAVIHNSGVYHGDLKPDNILFRNSIISITDWDLVSSIPDENERKSLATYSCILAPELFERKHPSTKSDIWAYGTNIFYIRMGKPPFPIDFLGDNEKWLKASFEERSRIVRETVLPKINNDNYYREVLKKINNQFDSQLASILIKCLEREPNKRFVDGRELYQTLQTTS